MFNKFFINIPKIIVVILTVAWIILSSLSFNRISFSVVTYQVKNTIKSDLPPKDLFGNSRFQGQFQSRDNNLGLIILTLNPHSLLNAATNGKVTFKLREKGKTTWNFQREYNLHLFDSQSNFAFGFPKIINSRNKEYQFELSLTTDDNNFIEIKKNENFITGYQYSRSKLSSGKEIVSFGFNKILGSFSDNEFIKALLLRATGLIFFLILLNALKHFIFKRLISILNVLKKITAILLTINDSKITFAICFTFIVLWLIVIPFGLQDLQNQLNIFVYGLLVVGCVQLFLEEKLINEKKKYR